MLIAARNGFLAGGGWKNPYVTDGLVAFYDGTWNAGPNKHDATLTAPVNLVTGEAATALINGIVFDSESMVFSGQKGGSAQPIIIDGNFTVDVLLSTSKSGSGICVALTSNVRWLQLGPYTSASVGWSVGNYSYPQDMTGRVGEIQSKACIVYRGEKLSSFTNGIFGTDIPYTGSVGSPPFLIGNNSFNSGSFNGNIYRILVYSRALTADEIAHNYAMDKARFNLP